MVANMPSHSNKLPKNQDAIAAGRLLLVATPIGNLGDITLRALEALKAADIIACEDTRTTATLLTHYGITTRTVAHHSHNEAASSAELVRLMAEGRTVALVSDAGTPLLSDPGARLVAAAIAASIAVQPLPGASALLAALTIAGLPAEQFYYGGFLPQKAKPRTGLLQSVQALSCTLVFYEAPHRLLESLHALHDQLGDRDAAVARELTKLYEECVRGRITQLIAHFTQHAPRGECVVLVHGAPARASMSDAAIDAALRDALTRGSVKQAAAELAELSGLPKRDLYQRALALK